MLLPGTRDRVRDGVVALVAWTVVRYAQLKWLGTGMGHDVGLYESYARTWASGATPYVDFHPEYPPGALLVFLVPHFWGADYAYNFAIEMAFFDLAAYLVCMGGTKVECRPDQIIILDCSAERNHLESCRP